MANGNGRDRGKLGAEGIKRLRSSLHLTQEEFAARVGVTRKTVSRWEKGHFAPCTFALKVLREMREARA